MNEYNNTSPSILVVDDEPINYDVIEGFLDAQGYQLYYAESGKEALEQLQRRKTDLILMDMMMPGENGLDLCVLIKQDQRWQGLPIIMVTALNTMVNFYQCLETGPDDFIGKPIDRIELQAKVRSMLRISYQYQTIREINNSLEEKVKERTQQLEQMIWSHSLTNLPSRFALLQKLENTINLGHPFALLYFDCDDFHLVNGCYGNEIGDQILLAIRERLTLCLQADDFFAHFGEDNFCIIVTNPLLTETRVQITIDQVFDSFSSAFWVSEQEIYLSISMGVVYEKEIIRTDAETILQNGKIALNWAKQEGKNNYQLFQPEMKAVIAEKLQLARDLRQALVNDEFEVYYQPIINLDNNSIQGFEALIRWQHPEKGLVSPGKFIPCLEETGLIISVGLVALEKACHQFKVWEERGFPNLQASVNLSPLQFRSETLLADIDAVLQKTGLSPSQLKLEITETLTVENPNQTIGLIKSLRGRGIEISIDDFGTGYSSLSYLRQFPVNNLKIDRAFINLLEKDESNIEIIRAIVQLGKALKMSITAEGIEASAQLKQLQQLGCEYAQGYYFAKPMSAENAFAYLSRA